MSDNKRWKQKLSCEKEQPTENLWYEMAYTIGRRQAVKIPPMTYDSCRD